MTQIKIKSKTIDLPDDFYMDQLLDVGLDELEQMQTILKDETTFTSIKPMLKWILRFLQSLGVEERFRVSEFMEMVQNPQFTTWLEKMVSDIKGNL